jgi:hypothetical protein
VNRVGVHRVKNPSRMRSVQVVVNQKPNVSVNQNRSSFIEILIVFFRPTASSEPAKCVLPLLGLGAVMVRRKDPNCLQKNQPLFYL